MHKTVADKNGGAHVELSSEEEAKVIANRSKNEAEQLTEQQKVDTEKTLADEAVEALTVGLSKTHKDSIKKMLKVN